MNMKYDWIKSNKKKKRTVRYSGHSEDNWKKGVDLIGQISGREKRKTNIG